MAAERDALNRAVVTLKSGTKRNLAEQLLIRRSALQTEDEVKEYDAPGIYVVRLDGSVAHYLGKHEAVAIRIGELISQGIDEFLNVTGIDMQEYLNVCQITRNQESVLDFMKSCGEQSSE
jgi:hypothetical protein